VGVEHPPCWLPLPSQLKRGLQLPVCVCVCACACVFVCVCVCVGVWVEGRLALKQMCVYVCARCSIQARVFTLLASPSITAAKKPAASYVYENARKEAATINVRACSILCASYACSILCASYVLPTSMPMPIPAFLPVHMPMPATSYVHPMYVPAASYVYEYMGRKL